jgi:hypothetical protein
MDRQFQDGFKIAGRDKAHAEHLIAEARIAVMNGFEPQSEVASL